MKYIKLLIIIPILFTWFSLGVQAQGTPAVPVSGNGAAAPKKDDLNSPYQLLEPLPGVGATIDPSTGFGDYANKLIRLLIGAAGALAVVMIVIGGIQYMSSDAVGEKQSGKETMSNAVIGLGLALVSYLLLYTINPKLTIIKDNLVPSVSVEVKVVPAIELKIQDNVDSGDDSVATGQGKNTNTTCPGTVINIPSGLQVKNSSVKIICKDLANKLINLQSNVAAKNIKFILTSTADGSHSSACHKPGNSQTGNCADIAIRELNGNTVPHTDPRWGELCKAVVAIQGLNFLNEATNQGICPTIRAFKTYAHTTAPHLHIMFTAD
jgi:hypothetical protein